MTPRATPAAALLAFLAFTFGAKAEPNSVLAAGASSPAAQAADGAPESAAPPRSEPAQPTPKPLDAPANAAQEPSATKAEPPATPPTPPPALPATPQPFATPAPASAAQSPRPSQPAADDDQALTRKLAEEAARVRKLTEQLRLIESAPVDPPTPPIAPQARPPARIEDIPATPVPQAREEYADALYTLGKYQAARAVYAEIAESKPHRSVLIWARLQTGHCSRRLKDYPAAVTAYESVMNDFSDNAWAKEAAWWSAEVKWWMLWNESVRRTAQPSTPTPPAAPPKQAATPASPATPAAASSAALPPRATAAVR